MSSWQNVAEQAAKQRGEAIIARIRAAIARHAPEASIDGHDDELRVRGRGLKRRWLSEPGLRFARRILP